MAESQKNQTEKENIVELKTNIYLLSIIGEVEGHESLGERTKATRYEHILPALARAEEDKSIDGLLILLNTVGGDVEAGLAIAEERLEELMLDTKMLVKDVGTMLDGPQAVEEGLIDEVGGIARALEKLNELMKKAAGTEN